MIGGGVLDILNGEKSRVKRNADLVENVCELTREESVLSYHSREKQSGARTIGKPLSGIDLLALADLGTLLSTVRRLEFRSHRVHPTVAHLVQVMQEGDEPEEDEFWKRRLSAPAVAKKPAPMANSPFTIS